MESLAGKRVTVAGLGRFGGGIAVTRWLCAQGAKVLVTDSDPPEKLADSLRQLEGLPLDFRIGEHRQDDFTSADIVVASPAIPPSNPYIHAARAAGKPVTTEIRLFIERCPAEIIGVTGTKGKSTTTAMLGKMLATTIKTWIGGNIGKSLLADLEQIGASDLVVLELSSYMLHHLSETRWSPHVAVVTMISQDHLKWHGSLEAYLDAKRNIIRFQQPVDFAVLNEEDPTAAGLAREAPGKVFLYGARNRRRFDLLIPGEHNQLNAQGAFTAASIFGVDFAQAQQALAEFPGLPHRLQLIHESAGVRYFNDSIATIPEAAVAALMSFPSKKVIQIVGGYGKEIPIKALCAALIERAKAVLCVGATGPSIADLLEQSPSQHAAATYRCGDLPTAVSIAKNIAASGDIVLLSPGFKSYDQFVNFEQRGDEFVKSARGY
ncbi:MAG TPA: UDP-N-acetylmuramoyl-L-alanine--D-glutamate ligase [Tepidisphaeraceae bacterium]|jgi:UDP-N-acetylmuramoylalanine--D-glutamate ligase|nr:UDP-N-acetylmuramoyl-L-alanine--D-glutamate ligase [Tepidisphaeraceae bacterium]